MYEDLLTRASRAATRAARLVRASRLLVQTSDALRRDAAATRCAWCGRFHVGEHWLGIDEVPGFPPRDVDSTHTICPHCWDELHASSRSAKRPED